MIIVTGSIAYDYIMDFPGKFGDQILPNQIHKINLSFIVSNFAKRRGGTAGNVSYSLGLLSTPHILFSAAGKDFSEYKKTFEDIGISTKHVVIDQKKYTSTGFAMTDKTNNQIWGYFYGAADMMSKLKLKTVTKKNDLVLVGPCGATGSMSFVRQCISLQVPYMFDPGFILTQINDEELALGVKHASYLIGNDYEITLIKKRLKNFNSLTEKSIVITTLGEKGAEIVKDKKIIKIKPAKPKKVIDPTGAGDAWRSGFLAGLERNYDLPTCAQMGAIAAVFAIEHYGTQEHAYTGKEFIKRYRQTYKSLLKL